MLVAVSIYFVSPVAYPFLHLATSAYVPGLILSVIFILMVAHEIMAGFIYVTSAGTSSSKSLRHFMVITVIYLGNLVLAYMHEAGLIHWDFLYINPYLLMTVSILLGIWGFRQRENLYENILPFNPYGAYLIIALSIITLSTTGMLLGNHNDVGLKVIRDVILFSHLGYGVIFFIYVVSNFMVMMADNLPAWKVLYKPTRMPYFTFRFAGLIATMAFVFYTGWREYVYHSTSGFYYQLADLYQLMDQRAIAEAYTQQARKYVAVNNRANYILGMQESSRNNFKHAHSAYELANSKYPTPYSMANNANLFMMEGRYFEGIEAMRKASEKFNSSGILQNNLGYAYSRIHRLDSALILFDQARQHKPSRAVAEANFLALIGNEYLPVNIDSLYRQFSSANPFTLSNALAGATQFRQSLDATVDLSTMNKLEPSTAALLNNYVVHHLKNLDTAFVNRAFRMANDPVNTDYSEALKATLAQAYYHQGHVTRALSTMAELAFLSQIMQGKFNYIAGLWALEQGCPELAISYFEYAVMFNYKEARLYNTLALAEAGYLSRALAEADSLLKHPNEDIQQIGRQLKKIITLPAAELNNLNDLEKYQFCRYRLTSRDTVLFNRIVATIGDHDLKVEALLDMSERQYDLMDMPAAIRYLNQTGGIPVRNKKLVERIQHA
jgi:tetratricopeptide (TPR) repeat protein